MSLKSTKAKPTKPIIFDIIPDELSKVKDVSRVKKVKTIKTIDDFITDTKGTGQVVKTKGGQQLQLIKQETKQIQKVIPKEKVKQFVIPSPSEVELLKSEQELKQISKQKQKLVQVQKFEQFPKQEFAELQKFKQIPKQRFAQVQLLKHLQAQAQPQRFRQPQVQMFKQIFKKPKLLPPKKPRFAEFPTQRIGGFEVFGRRFGKFKVIGVGRTEKEAFSIGKRFARGTLGVTFKIPKSKRLIVPGFRTKKTKEGVLFIEPRGKRLKRGTGEIPEIQFFKAIKKKKGGKKK